MTHRKHGLTPMQVLERIWIQPYAKGPEDKPWMQTTKLYSLER